MLKIAVLVSGGGTNLQAVIEHIESGELTDTKIEIVISNNKRAYALKRAADHGIEHRCISPKDYIDRELYYEALETCLLEHHIDLIVLAGFMVVIPERIIRKYRHRIINVHPSLIPAFCGTGYYGLKVHEAAIKKGVKVSGATVHFVDEGTDTGPIILQKAVEVHQDDTPESLQKRIMEEAEWVLLSKAIDMIAHHKVSIVDGKAWLLV